MSKKNIKEYIGQVFINNQNLPMEIIEVPNTQKVKVRFENGYETIAQMSNIKRGRVKNPYHPTIHDVGFVGDGEYQCRVDGKVSHCYKTWSGMLFRCYKQDKDEKYVSWEDCTVCEEWHNFQNFAKWYYDNYYEIDDEKMHLDKDWLQKGNKVYSPTTCVFVPQTINSLLISRKRDRGNCVIGVSKNGSQYYAQMTKLSKHVGLGLFFNEIDAFNCYKKHKEDYIQEVANKYKGLIPIKLYNAMVNYKVEITD